MIKTQSPVFAIVAGEASGDTLGADLIKALRKRYPEAHFEGIGGPKMQAQGFVSLFTMDRLAVMGLIDPLKRLPELLSIRRSICRRYKDNPPRVFIGIDAPDFNLTIEQKLRRQGVKTVHYVSPSVWAWRQGRIKKIKDSVDLMLTLFPFEADFYHRHAVPVCFVGHPLAKQFLGQVPSPEAKSAIGLVNQRPSLCIMPGSRAGEVELLAELFLDAAAVASRQMNQKLQLVIPAANAARYQQLEKIIATRDEDIILLRQQSDIAMGAADVVLLASGTTAMEAMLLKKPMVVGYKLGNLTYRLVRPFIKTPFVAIPNLLAGEMLVPELLQADVSVPNLAAHLVTAFEPNNCTAVIAKFDKFHQQLALDSGDLAARAIGDLIAEKPCL
jgi:lipid-A-disaccharide synthase